MTNKLNKALLISAFPGTGKSYFKKRAKGKVLDSDSSTFDKSNFPENYIKHIKDNMDKADIILISSHEEVRKALVNNNLKFILVYPEIGLKDEYLKRYKERGNPQSFINLIDKEWDNWINQMKNQDNCLHQELHQGQYISDLIYKNK